MSKEQEKNACDWLENLEGDAWADACEEIAGAVKRQAEGAQDDRPEFERQFNMTGWHIDESYRSGSSYKYQEQRMAFDAWKIARSALAQPSPKCATCNDNGVIGGFVGADSGYQDDPCPDCAQPSPAPELDDQAFDRNAERLTFQALGPGAGINPEATSIDDIFIDEAPAPELPERGTQHRFSTTEQTFRHDFAGVWWSDAGVTKTGRECRYCGFFVADMTEAPEQPKRYTADVFYHNHFSTVQMEVVRASHFDEFAAQSERIVEALRADLSTLIEVRNGLVEEIGELHSELADVREERNAAQAKLDELEKQQPVAWVTETDPDVTMGRGINWFPKNVAKLLVGTKLYAAPVAQAGQVPEGCAPGTYAIDYRDNWDGEGDRYFCIAEKTADGKWIRHESGQELLEYKGDAILAAWLLAASEAQERDK